MAKVLFLQTLWYDYIGVMALSAALRKAGHEPAVEIVDRFPSVERAIRKENPDIVGFSLMSGLHPWAIDMTRQIRAAYPDGRPFVIYGGPHPTFFPGILEKSMADAVCVGEGEGAIVDLANCLDSKKSPARIGNLFVKDGDEVVRNPVRCLENLDELPFPDRSVYYRHKYFRSNPTKPFMAGRGCPYNCTFCYNKKMRDIYRDRGSFVRLIEPARVIEEILDVRERWGLKTVYFFDDTFALNKKWTFELMEAYKREVDLPFICRVRANTVDEELVETLKRAGCFSAFFAIETANEELREKVLRKRVTDEDIYRTAGLLKKHGIKFLTYNMVGIPGETVEDAYEMIKLNVEIGTSYPWCSIFSPYPGTELAKYCEDNGYIRKGIEPDELLTTFHHSPVVDEGSRDEITNIHKFFQLAVLAPGLLPIIRRAAKLRPNIFHTLIFSVVYFINYVRSERLSIFRTLVLAYHNMGLMLGWKRT